MIRPLLLATSNAGKVREFRGLLGGAVPVFGLGEAPFAALPAPQVPELGDTYYENALAKAVGYWRHYRDCAPEFAVLADDSGIEVDVLDGAPGVHSADFGGVGLTWPERWRRLYEAIAPFPRERWTARFRAVLCYYDGRGVPRFFEGVCEGHIAVEPAGGKGFGYDPILRSVDLGKTFGEATDEEKATVSHRALAVASFLTWRGTKG